ncbi:MAG: nuclear transport factor 2 family protein [Gammaproteobacteria bacterium]|nr:nuclear transport factor 2 family protein [Gammaproteobacteria bacterium]
MNLYSPDIKVFDAWEVWACDHAESWRGMIGDWFGSLGDERVRVSFDEVRTLWGGELTLLTAIVTYARFAEDDKNLRALQNRLTWAIRRVNGVARIVHEHTSMPVGLDDKKAILSRRSR